MSVPEYIGHESFRVHCLGVEFNGVRKVLWGDDEVRKWLAGWKDYKGDYCFVMHNAYFDAAILAWHYKFVPAHMTDTLLIANHVLGPAREGGGSNSLDSLATRLGLQAKGKLDFMDGVTDPSPEQRTMLEVYLSTDLNICRKILDALLPHVNDPDTELWLIDHTIRLYATRPLILNFDTVTRAEGLVAARRKSAMDRLSAAYPEQPPEGFALMLSSNKQFESVLGSAMRKYGQPMPTKVRNVTDAERRVWAKKVQAVKLASEGPPPEITALGGKSVAKWQRAADKVLATAHLLPDALGKTVVVPALSKQDEGFVDLCYSPYEGISALVTARLVERSSDTSRSRLAKMRSVAGGLGVMPVHLVYGGAHTGRFAGGGGFNFQNLTSPARVTDPGQKAIAAAIREAFEAPPGYMFVAADASQIECRVAAWITGQWDLLARFARRADVYSESISSWAGEEVRKPTKEEEASDDPAIRAKVARMALLRHVGKEAVLGLGYGMGHKKFIARLRSNPAVAQMFTSGALTESFCESIVKKYRADNGAITAGWDALNGGFHAAREGGVRSVGPITFRRGVAIGDSRPVVRACLPSGRELYYRGLRSEPDKIHGRVQWKHGGGQRVYGGLLLENVTQAISRDLLVCSIVRAETELDLPVVLHVHDSIAVLSPEDKAEDCLKLLIQSLRTNPEWAGSKLVLDAEGKISRTLVT